MSAYISSYVHGQDGECAYGINVVVNVHVMDEALSNNLATCALVMLAYLFAVSEQTA